MCEVRLAIFVEALTLISFRAGGWAPDEPIQENVVDPASISGFRSATKAFRNESTSVTPKTTDSYSAPRT